MQTTGREEDGMSYPKITACKRGRLHIRSKRAAKSVRWCACMEGGAGAGHPEMAGRAVGQQQAGGRRSYWGREPLRPPVPSFASAKT